MDGTLTVPAIDFAAVRKDIGMPTGDILLEMEKWPEERRARAWEVIERYESAVTVATELQEGCSDFLLKLRGNGCKTAILTRNSRKSVNAFLEKIGIPFDSILTREHTHVKPSPVPVEDILTELDLGASEALVVGDYVHDLEAGAAAGTATCFFQNPDAASFAEFADFTVASYTELDKIVFG
jgi:HAD superfamily hydrolase (TIGR01549 family)